MKTMISIVESKHHPDFSALYKDLKIDNIYFNSIRKTISKLKSHQPDYIVAEFFYGYSNNYAGVNISNLDVLLYSLQKYSPQTRVIVMFDKSERQYVPELNKLFTLHGTLQHPVSPAQIKSLLC